jgi:hypothetical protein
MSRRIVTTAPQAAGAGGETIDGYLDRVIKYIPADIVAGWLFLDGLIRSGEDERTALLWIVFLVLIPITAVWTYQRTQEPGKPPAWTQTVIATASFVVWIFAIGGPFATGDWYDSIYGAILIVLYTLAIGAVTPSEG